MTTDLSEINFKGVTTDLSEINFKGDNPGAVRYGNFINYYQFHPAQNRMKSFPINIWRLQNERTCVCLDIGCNAGDLTISLFEFFKHNVCHADTKCRFLGIDIDPTLITRAKEINKYPDAVEFQHLDIMDDKQSSQIEDYLRQFKKSTFNITFCFSITMWIHLNHGDDGLKRFLTLVCARSDVVVVEPQPWKCYKTAVKRLKLSNAEFPLFSELKHRQDVETFIESTLEQHCAFVKVAETPPSTWGRRILFYEREKR